MPVERVDILAQIAQGANVPIAAGERWMGKWIFFDALSRGALSVLQPDICHAGGITECRKIAVMGEAAYAQPSVALSAQSARFGSLNSTRRLHAQFFGART